MGLLLVSTHPIYAEESPAFAKIRDASPDGKFVLRISCTIGPAAPGDIDSGLITGTENRPVSNYVKEKHPSNE